MNTPTKYSDQLVDWLCEAGYTHCFFVAGGNIMHLLDSVRTRMTCIPFVNEIGAAIAAEYYTQARQNPSDRAFVLVTAGPGLTNTITAIASAWTESRELLVIGGQVKSSDLSLGQVRQRGIQEIDGLPIVRSICKTAIRLDKPVSSSVFLKAVTDGSVGRPGPVFIEICLDVQAVPPIANLSPTEMTVTETPSLSPEDINKALRLLSSAERPALLLGGGIKRDQLRELDEKLVALGIPIFLTWNGLDLLPADHPLFAGRPNTWGQRHANATLQQADVLIAVGTRLGLQQTGFAWEQFLPVGKLIHVDIDNTELVKGHPKVEIPVNADGISFLRELLDRTNPRTEWSDWRAFIADVQERLPLNDSENSTAPGFVPPYEFLMELSDHLGSTATIVPSSSGSAFTVTMQSIQLRGDQRVISNKGMASMGYGLSGAIGAGLANPTGVTVLLEGDGSFAQNLQELGTLVANNLNLKILLFANDGYASIRMTQRNYFNGAWVGCDSSTGLGLPKWKELASAFNIPYLRVDSNLPFNAELISLLKSPGPAFIEVPIDPEQTFFPKITSAVQQDGSMTSNPLHLMSPPLSEEVSSSVFKYMKLPMGES